MTDTIDDVFVTQFEGEVHMEFQRMGSALRNTVRVKNNVKGSTDKFPVAGTGTAGAKSRHGNVPIMNASRQFVTVTLQDRYAGEYIDKLDTLKIEHDERQVAAQSIAAALGRDVDDILLTAMDATTNANNRTAETWATDAAPRAVMEAFGNANVPFDRNLFACICWEAWGDLVTLDEFSRQEYVPGDKVWFEGITPKFWLGFNYFPHSGLAVDGTGDYKQFFYHRTAVGHAIGQDFSLDVGWITEKQANLAVGSMSHGAVIIQDEGVIEAIYDVTP